MALSILLAVQKAGVHHLGPCAIATPTAHAQVLILSVVSMVLVSTVRYVWEID